MASASWSAGSGSIPASRPDAPLAARGHRANAARLVAALPGAAPVFAADLLLTPLFERHPARFKIYTAHNVELDHFRAARPAARRASSWAREIEALEARAARAAA